MGSFSGRQLAAQGLLHQLTDARRRQILAQQEVQLGERSLGGHVKTRDDPGPRQRVAGGIAPHVDLAVQTLAQVDDDDTPGRCPYNS